MVPRDFALKVRANRTFTDTEGNKHEAGDEWLIKGPAIYIPKIEEGICRKNSMTITIVLTKNNSFKQVKLSNSF